MAKAPLLSAEIHARQLLHAADAVRETKERHDLARDERNDLIVTVARKGTMSLRRIAKVTGLGYPRVQQIVHGWEIRDPD